MRCSTVQLLGGEGEGTRAAGDRLWLVASSVGKFPLGLSAVVPGTQPFVDSTSVEFHGVAGPAVRVDLAPKAATIVTGQSLAADRAGRTRRPTTGRTIGRAGSPAPPRSRGGPPMASITGVAPGKAQLTASAGGASATLDVRVVLGDHREADALPVQADGPPGRRGRVHRGGARRRRQADRGAHADLELLARRRAARCATAASWRTAPGVYTVTATLGRRAASTTVTVARAGRAAAR